MNADLEDEKNDDLDEDNEN